MPQKKRSSDLSYLQRLQFNPQLLNSWVAKYFSQIRIVLLLIIAVVSLGIFSYLNLPKRLNPEVEIPIVTVVTLLPGASPDDVESLVTIPLENSLQGLEGLDVLTSTSQDNISIITTQFLSSVETDKAKDLVQSQIDTVTSLPDTAETPTVRALDFEDAPIWTFSLTTDGDLPSLLTFSNELEKKLADLPKVDRVSVGGYEEQEIVIAVSPEKLQQYGLNPLQISQLLQTSLRSFPAGTVSTSSFSYAVTIDPRVETIQDIRDLQITTQNEVVSLGDIAEISLRSKTGQAPAYVATAEDTPQRAVTFSVFKTSSTNIDDAGEEVRELVESELEKQQGRYELITIVNTADAIDEQFVDLLGEFRSTILLVFACLLLFLGLRQAVIASFTVPLTFLSAFFIMQMVGMSINFLSLFAFLLALGLLVDDTIVVVSAMTSYYKTGKFTPLQTGLLVWKDTIVPIWSTTLTTIWSFIPLLITSGIIGEFIKPIPIVVTATMVSSTAIATLITLPIMIFILKPQLPKRVLFLLKVAGVIGSVVLLFVFLQSNVLLPVIAIVWILLLVLVAVVGKKLVSLIKNKLNQNPRLVKLGALLKQYSDKGVINMDGFAEKYRVFVLRMLASAGSRRRVMIGVVIYAIFSFMLLPLGFVKNEFFPKVDGDNVYVTVELPAGITKQTGEDLAFQLLEDFRVVPEVEYVTAEVGKGVGDFGGSVDDSSSVLFTLHLTEVEERERSSQELSQDLRTEYKDFKQGEFLVIEESGGPPAGADIQITLLGNELSELTTYSNQIRDFLEQQPGITNVQVSIEAGPSRYVFIPNQALLAENGITVDTLGIWLRIFSSGLTFDDIQLESGDQEKTDIVFKTQYGLANPEKLSAIAISKPNGQSIPLSALGTFELRTNPTQITREEGKRTITITGAVTGQYSVTEANADLETFADELTLAEGYSWKTGGINEENQESINSLLQAMLISALLIMITMVIEFGSFRQAFIVMIVIPFAVSSVFLIFALTGTPLSFPALIGVLSLFGIVVTNSMFIVDKININRRQGMKIKEAIADAGASRLEPILLTKLSTVLGLLPITLSDPLWRGLGGAIISGLLISSTIMLLFIPALYYTIYQNED